MPRSAETKSLARSRKRCGVSSRTGCLTLRSAADMCGGCAYNNKFARFLLDCSRQHTYQLQLKSSKDSQQGADLKSDDLVIPVLAEAIFRRQVIASLVFCRIHGSIWHAFQRCRVPSTVQKAYQQYSQLGSVSVKWMPFP